MASGFMEKLKGRFLAQKLVCVGLDSDISKLPQVIREKYVSSEEALFVFNRAIIDATADFAVAFKPNSAFYEMEGEAGYRALRRTVDYLKEHYSEIPIIFDAKRADVENTNEAYARAIFDDLSMDAVTVHPYMGKESLAPFLARKDKGIFVLVKTSNSGSGEFQDLTVGNKPLYQKIAEDVAKEWNMNGNCGVVVGATYPEELKLVRGIIGEMPILVPGVGSQGGDVSKTILAGKGTASLALIVNSSRGIIYASSGADFGDVARKAAQALSDSIQTAILQK